MRVDRGVMPMLSLMERTGMRIDPSHIAKLKVQLLSEMEALAAKVEMLSGKSINIASGDQLSDLLFNHLKLKQNGREKWTKSRERLAADGDVLKAMLSQHPCIRPILDWKEREKLRSTYTDSLVAKADENLRIHTDISSISTDTGRLASSNPNLQNIPIRTELGNEIRNAFVPENGLILAEVDASQIEMRLNAEDSQCVNMMGFFHRKEDFYWGTAGLMYKREFPQEMRSCKCPHDATTKKIAHVKDCPTIIKAPGEPFDGMTYKKWYRDICAKVTSLMVGYDASAGGLYDQFLAWGVPGWTEELCAHAIIDYFAGYPELLARKKVHTKRAMRYGFVWDLGGRVRWIPQMKSVHKRIVNEGMRQAGNLAGQGGAAFIIKLWMAILWADSDYWTKHGLKFLMQIHDSLLVEGPQQVVTDWAHEACDILGTFIEPYTKWFSTPLAGSIGLGEIDAPWGSLSH